MPSWHDGSTSSERLPEFNDIDYAPDTTEEPTFHGLAVGSGERCRVHNLEPVRCVAFEGTNTGRRFYLCSIENIEYMEYCSMIYIISLIVFIFMQHVLNCGFHAWVDSEWPEPLQNALKKLWEMYYSSNSGRIDDKLEHARFVEELVVEKNKIEKKYASLLVDVKKFAEETEKRVVERNYKLITSGAADEINELKKEVAELKQLQKTQAEVIRAKKEELEAGREAWKTETDALKKEKDALNEEKRKLEYMLYDQLKLSNGNKDKLKRIRKVCEEELII
nr:uncharacterized protein LOC127334007 [Lolium perenne]